MPLARSYGLTERNNRHVLSFIVCWFNKQSYNAPWRSFIKQQHVCYTVFTTDIWSTRDELPRPSLPRRCTSRSDSLPPSSSIRCGSSSSLASSARSCRQTPCTPLSVRRRSVHEAELCKLEICLFENITDITATKRRSRESWRTLSARRCGLYVPRSVLPTLASADFASGQGELVVARVHHPHAGPKKVFFKQVFGRPRGIVSVGWFCAFLQLLFFY